MTLHVGAAAAAIASIRTHTAQRTGCPEWDATGIATHLVATEGSPGSVLAAAALAAEDPSLLKPSPRAFANHWPKNATSERPVSHRVACPDHPDHDMPCSACTTTRYVPTDEDRAAWRNALADAPRYVPPAVKRAQAQEDQP